jgi:hypothetical protein
MPEGIARIETGCFEWAVDHYHCTKGRNIIRLLPTLRGVNAVIMDTSTGDNGILFMVSIKKKAPPLLKAMKGLLSRRQPTQTSHAAVSPRPIAVELLPT